MFHEDDHDVSFDRLRDKIPQVRAVVRYSPFKFLLPSRKTTKLLGRYRNKLRLVDIWLTK